MVNVMHVLRSEVLRLVQLLIDPLSSVKYLDFELHLNLLLAEYQL